MLPLPCMLVCPFLLAQNRTRDLGCSKHPVFPAPSIRREGKRCKPRAKRVARSRPHIQLSSPGLTGRSSIPETARLESRSRGVLDAPVKPGHDSEFWGTRSRVRCFASPRDDLSVTSRTPPASSPGSWPCRRSSGRSSRSSCACSRAPGGAAGSGRSPARGRRARPLRPARA